MNNNPLINTNIKLINAKKLLVALSFLFVFIGGLPVKGGGASLYFSAEGDSFGAGETFFVDVKIDAGSLSINAAQVRINFPEDKLKIEGTSKDNSIFSLWPDEPAFSNEKGELFFSGGLPHPGFQGNNGQVLRIQFKAEKEGEIKLNFDNSQVLADDGEGTDVLSRVFEETYLIRPSVPEILSGTHPEQGRWYSANNLEIYWQLSQDTTKVSFVLDKYPQTWPDEIPEGRISSYTYKNIEDGIWFFHLRVKTDKGWSNARHFQVLIDTTPPQPFDIVIDNEGDPTNPQPVLYFKTDDSVSGVDRYVVKIGEGADVFTEILPSNPFQMPLREPGVYQVVVEAFDKAENYRDSLTRVEIEPIQKPVITVWPGKFISGSETFYLAGTALPEVEIIIFLRRNSQDFEEWRTRSNERGEWSFSSSDILKSGFYHLSAMAQDGRGAVSKLSEEKNIEIDFSGLELGSVMVTFAALAVVLLSVFILAIIFIGFSAYKAFQLRKYLRKETKEAKEALYQSFLELEKEVERKIEMLDQQSGFNKQERMVYDDLLRSIKITESSIDKEISDISNYLR